MLIPKLFLNCLVSNSNNNKISNNDDEYQNQNKLVHKCLKWFCKTFCSFD